MFLYGFVSAFGWWSANHYVIEPVFEKSATMERKDDREELKRELKKEIKKEIKEEVKKDKYLTDKNGKVRVFVVRAMAAKESHVRNGQIEKTKNGYVIKLKENEDDCIPEKTIFMENSRGHIDTHTRSSNVVSGERQQSQFSNNGRSDYLTENTGSSTRQRLTLQEIRTKQKTQIQESIDKGIESGLSMAGAGESIGRDTSYSINRPIQCGWIGRTDSQYSCNFNELPRLKIVIWHGNGNRCWDSCRCYSRN
jgi:hypothetical protein